MIHKTKVKALERLRKNPPRFSEFVFAPYLSDCIDFDHNFVGMIILTSVYGMTIKLKKNPKKNKTSSLEYSHMKNLFKKIL